MPQSHLRHNRVPPGSRRCARPRPAVAQAVGRRDFRRTKPAGRSPSLGFSTLMTAAPRSASSMPASGPVIIVVNSRTRTPSSGPVIFPQPALRPAVWRSASQLLCDSKLGCAAVSRRNHPSTSRRAMRQPSLVRTILLSIRPSAHGATSGITPPSISSFS